MQKTKRLNKPQFCAFLSKSDFTIRCYFILEYMHCLSIAIAFYVTFYDGIDIKQMALYIYEL